MAEEFGLKYKKVYKIEWDIRNHSEDFMEIIDGYPDEAALGRALLRLEQRGRAKTHYKPLKLFKVTKMRE